MEDVINMPEIHISNLIAGQFARASEEANKYGTIEI